MASLTPTATLPAGYEPRLMFLALAPCSHPRGARRWEWRFVSAARDYSVAARWLPSTGVMADAPLVSSFKSRAEARLWAEEINLPPYAEWSGARRTYTGQPGAYTLRVHPRA